MRLSTVAVVSLVLLLSVIGCTGKPATEPANKAPDASKATPPKAETAAKDAAKPTQEKAGGILKSWDFVKLPAEQWEWRFPGGAHVQTPRGAMSECNNDGNCVITLRGQQLDTKEIAGFTVACESEKQGKQPPVENVMVFWARPGDYQEGKWPFDKKRSITLKYNDPLLRNMFTTAVSKHPEWTGTISDLAIQISLPKLPDDAPKSGPRCVVTRSVTINKP